MDDLTKTKEILKKILCPPGSGVFTVHTAKEQKNNLQKKIYSGEDPQKSWEQSLDALSDNKRPLILGIPSDCGGGILRGTNWGPLFIRHFLYQHATSPDVFELGDVKVNPHLLSDELLNRATINQCQNAMYGPEQDLPVSPLSIAELAIKTLFKTASDSKILTLGGDHSISYPVLKEFLLAKKKQGIKVGIAHFDAHTDLLEHRLGIDVCFGSWTSHILKYLDDPSLLVQIGIRSSAKERNHWESKFNLAQFWAKDITSSGISETSNQVLDHFKQKRIDEIYITFDIDCIDKKYASATGTPEGGGLEPHQAIALIQSLSSQFNLTGADLVEVAPFISHGHLEQDNHNAYQSTLLTARSVALALLDGLKYNPKQSTV